MALTVDQVAAELQIGVNRCYELVEARVIPAFRISNGSIRIPRDLLHAWCIARAMEETYSDDTGGLNLPPFLALMLSGAFAADAGVEVLNRVQSSSEIIPCSIPRGQTANGVAPESGRRRSSGARRRPGRPKQSRRADKR